MCVCVCVCVCACVCVCVCVCVLDCCKPTSDAMWCDGMAAPHSPRAGVRSGAKSNQIKSNAPDEEEPQPRASSRQAASSIIVDRPPPRRRRLGAAGIVGFVSVVMSSLIVMAPCCRRVMELRIRRGVCLADAIDSIDCMHIKTARRAPFFITPVVLFTQFPAQITTNASDQMMTCCRRSSAVDCCLLPSCCTDWFVLCLFTSSIDTQYTAHTQETIASKKASASCCDPPVGACLTAFNCWA